MRLLALALLLLSAGAGVRAAPLPQGVTEVDSGLYFAQLYASFEEWNATFADFGADYGPVHLWVRCVGLELRGLVFVESVNEKHPLLVSAGMHGNFSLERFVILINGLPVRTEIANVGEFLISTRTIAHLPVITIGVTGWRHYAEFPMRHCTPPAPLPAAQRRIMSVYTWDNPSTSVTDTAAFVNVLAKGLEQHSRYHKCALNITRYEVLVQENYLPLLLQNKYIANQVRRGFYALLVKNDHPARVFGSRPMWQGVYYNLAVLRHWKSRAALWFIDPDEFFVAAPGAQLGALLEENAGLVLRRRGIRCADCAANRAAEALTALGGHSYELADSWLLPKVVVNPDRTGCVAVHWAFCGKHVRKLDSKQAFLAHFSNWLVWRNSTSLGAAPESFSFSSCAR